MLIQRILQTYIFCLDITATPAAPKKTGRYDKSNITIFFTKYLDFDIATFYTDDFWYFQRILINNYQKSESYDKVGKGKQKSKL